MHKRTLLLFVSSLILFSTLVTASVGLGVSPSKVNYTVEGGDTITDYYLFYNPGTDPIRANVVAEGEIMPFTAINPLTLDIEPEPLPHALPPKNGKIVTVRYKVPAGTELKKYSGMIVATGGEEKGTYGATGSVTTEFTNVVAIAMRVDISAQKTSNFLKFLSPQPFLFAGGLVIIALLLFLARNSVKISLQKKSRKRAR